MRRSEFRAKMACFNYAIKKAWKHWDNYEYSNFADLDEIDTAITYCSLAIKSDPQNASSYYFRGHMYLYKHWFKWACRDSNKALSLGLNDTYVHTDLGMAYMHLDECSKAVNNFSNVLAIDSEDSFVWAQRGYTFLKFELYDKAIPDLVIALSLNPKERFALGYLNRAYLERGHLYLKADRNLEAVDDFTNATNSNDSIVQAYEGRATAFTNLGKIDEAKADIAKAKFFQEEYKHSKKNSHD